MIFQDYIQSLSASCIFFKVTVIISVFSLFFEDDMILETLIFNYLVSRRLKSHCDQLEKRGCGRGMTWAESPQGSRQFGDVFFIEVCFLCTSPLLSGTVSSETCPRPLSHHKESPRLPVWWHHQTESPRLLGVLFSISSVTLTSKTTFISFMWLLKSEVKECSITLMMLQNTDEIPGET